MTTGSRAAQDFLEKLTGGPLTLGEALWSIRECEEWSQAEMARRLSISRQNLCDIEKGRRPVSPERAAQWARILGYGEAEFVRLALQAMLDQGGLGLTVEVRAKERKGRRKRSG